MVTSKSYGSKSEEDEIKQALLERPRFSIKARLSIMLLLLFFISAIVSGVAMFMLSRIDYRIQYIFLADKISNEIQHARRIEKNYFLYNSDLPEIRSHLKNAKQLLLQASQEFGYVIGEYEINNLSYDLRKYGQYAEKLIQKDNDSSFINSDQFEATAQKFRRYGTKILELSLDISKKERLLISTTVSTAQNAHIILMIVILVLVIYIIFNFNRHISSRLSRLLKATQRLAAGDFTKITPRRKYKDEFSFLAIAFNHMIYELEKQQNLLVESHKLRAIGNLTAGIAHELNNPLNNIIITSEMLKEDFNNISDEECIDMLNDLVDQGERAHQVVKNLLDFARESETQAEYFYIDNLINHASRMVYNQVKLSKVNMVKEIEKNLPPIYGDFKMLTQVFINLFINSIDAMPDGGTVVINVKEEKNTGFLAVKVTDTGSGIPGHLLKSIFNPFFTTKPEGEGTGLGLSVSKGIIEKHGGDIEVVSQVGQGTSFTIYFPCIPIPADIRSNKNKFDEQEKHIRSD